MPVFCFSVFVKLFFFFSFAVFFVLFSQKLLTTYVIFHCWSWIIEMTMGMTLMHYESLNCNQNKKQKFPKFQRICWQSGPYHVEFDKCL